MKTNCKSYYHAHESAYQEIQAKGFVGWGNVPSVEALGDPVTNAYLTSVVAGRSGSALDLGCGTGTTAFLLAKLGFEVTGIDISQTAIEMARGLAQSQNLRIDFKTGDILELETLNKKFGIIYDSHCLHCIVLDEDRRRVMEGVKSSLAPDGIFILDTMVAVNNKFEPGHDSLRFDQDYILWHRTRDAQVRGTQEFGGELWCAQRRIYPAKIVLDEVSNAGFRIMQQREDDGMLRLVLGHAF